MIPEPEMIQSKSYDDVLNDGADYFSASALVWWSESVHQEDELLGCLVHHFNPRNLNTTPSGRQRGNPPPSTDSKGGGY